jgi:NAD+ synthase (glutamine-hydrolysing)
VEQENSSVAPPDEPTVDVPVATVAVSAAEERTPLLAARQFDHKRIIPLLPYEASWRALTLGVGDYVRKNGFEVVVLGLSGGIDSAVTAALAVDALGAENVHGVLMSSPNSSPGSVTDAEALAANLGITTLNFPISEMFEGFLPQSKAVLGTPGSDLAIQNLQARLRTVILMHLSNTYGWLLLNTGNKSEAAMGYSTLYGDTAGAIAPLGNIYKTDVYGLATWRNSRSLVIPQEIIEKEPSAELYPGQKDADALPPYEVLDQILRLHIEENLGVDEILEFLSEYPIKTDIDEQMILDVLVSVRKSEFKRRQEPMSFQFDAIDMTQHRAWPVTNGFTDHSRDIIAPTEIVNYLSMMYREVGPSGFDFMDN